MTIIEQSIDLAGKIRMTCQLSNGDSLSLKFAVQPTQAQLDEIEANYLSAHTYDAYHQELISIYDHADVLADFIMKVKQTPTVTLAQYNTWLSGKPWQNQAIIRFFVYALAMKLSSRYGLVLANYTESTVLGKLRDWIVATPAKQIQKIVYGVS